MTVRLTGSTVVRRAELLSADIGGEIVLMRVESGKYYGLDEIGSEIWRRLETPLRIDALCAGLEACYAAEPETIARDVLALFADLLAQDLVTVQDSTAVKA